MKAIFKGNYTAELRQDGHVTVPASIAEQFELSGLDGLSMWRDESMPATIHVQNVGRFSGDFVSFPSIPQSRKIRLPETFARSLLVGGEESVSVSFVGIGPRFQIMESFLWQERLERSREYLRLRRPPLKALPAALSQNPSFPAAGGVLIALHQG